MRKKRILSLALASWMSLSLIGTTASITAKAEENMSEQAAVVEVTTEEKIEAEVSEEAWVYEGVEADEDAEPNEAEADETVTEADVIEDTTDDYSEEQSSTEEAQAVEEEIDSQAAAGGIKIDATSFPDATLRNIITYKYNVNGYVYPANIKELCIDDCSSYKVANIKDFTGIEKLTEIEKLTIKNGANMAKLDLSCYPKLANVEVRENNIESIVGLSAKIETLDCAYNKINSLELSKAINLVNLMCNGNLLTRLDLSNNTKLKILYVMDNDMESLDVTKLTELEQFFAYDNKLKSINLSNCKKLTDIGLSENELESLDLSNLSELDFVDVRSNKLKTIKLNTSGKLTQLYCWWNELTSLDLSGQKGLQYVECNSNKIEELDLSDTPIIRLYCENNNLKSLNLSGCTQLQDLDCSNNNLDELNISDSVDLCALKCRYNNIKYLDLRYLNPRSDKYMLLDCVQWDPLQKVNVYVDTNFDNKRKFVDNEKLIEYNSVNDYSNANIIKLSKSGSVPEITTKPITTTYSTHIQTYSWSGDKKNGESCGTMGEAKRLEAIKIKVSGDTDLGVTYQTHIQKIGWQDWKKDGDISGTSGKALRLEAIRIKLTGKNAYKYDIYYRVHAQSYGWLGWAKDGEPAGTAGQAKRLEAIQIVVVPKGQRPKEECNAPAFVELGKFAQDDNNYGMVNYMTHVQSYGDQNFVYDGSVSGTSGEAKRLEAIRIYLSDNKTGETGGITYSTHIQKIGWQDWKSNGELSGTSGQALRLEGIKIKLTGDIANKYDVYYRVHAQKFGWLGWAKNGAPAGTEGYAYRLEGIQIVLVPKGGKAPGATNNCFVKK